MLRLCGPWPLWGHQEQSGKPSALPAAPSARCSQPPLPFPAPHRPRENETLWRQLRQKGMSFLLGKEKMQNRLYTAKGCVAPARSPGRPAQARPLGIWDYISQRPQRPPRGRPVRSPLTLSSDWLLRRRAGPTPANGSEARYGGGSSGAGLRGGGQSASASAAAAGPGARGRRLHRRRAHESELEAARRPLGAALR